MNTPFYTKRNELTDGSVIWEVWQRGCDQRLASSESRNDAAECADALNHQLQRFTARVSFTIDA